MYNKERHEILMATIELIEKHNIDEKEFENMSEEGVIEYVRNKVKEIRNNKINLLLLDGK